MAVAPLQFQNVQAFTPTLDFSPLERIGKSIDAAEQRRTLADLGKQIEGGSVDLKGAAGRAISLGDLASGTKLLTLASEQEQRRTQSEADRSLYGSMPGMGVQTSQPASGQSGSPNYANAIASIESGGKYDALGPTTKTGDRAYGKFQIMGANIPQWTQEVLGRSMTPQEFIANPQAQDAVFQAKFGNYVQKYGPEGAAKAWFAGERGMNNPNAKDQLGTSVSSYAQRFTSALGPQGGGQSSIPANAQPAQGALPPQQGNGDQLSPRAQWAARGLQQPNISAAMRKHLETILDNETASGKAPDAVRQYQFARQQGYQGSFVDFKKELSAAGATSITNDMRGENAEAKAMGEASGKRAGEMLAAAGAASKGLMSLSRIEGLLGQVEQGKIQPGRMSISAWAKSMGLNDQVAESLGLDPKGVGSAQALQSLVAESVLGKIGSGGLPANNFSDADREFLVSIFPRISNDPRANKILVEAARRVFQQDIAKAKAFREFKRDPNNKGSGFADFEIAWSEKVAQQDVFGDLRRRAEEIMGPPRDVNIGQQSAQPQNTAPAQVSSPDDARRLPPGTRFITPDGREFVR